MKWWSNVLKKEKKAGFSLIELMIVICIIGFLASLMIVNVSSFNSVIVRLELNKLYGTCLYLQKCAQATQKKQRLIFDIAHNSYFFKGHVEQLSSCVQFNVKDGAKGPPSHPVNAIDKAITFEHEQITFHPDGIIQSGTIYLTDKDNRSLYALSSGVSQVSFLRKYRYDNGWHLLS